MTALPSRPGVGRGLCLTAAVALAVAGSACRPRSTPQPSDTLTAAGGATAGAAATTEPSAAPQLASLAPLTIALGKGEVPTLTLTGSGFVPGARGAFGTGGNTIRVGPASFDSVAADDAGKTIRFALPLGYTDTTARGRPQSFGPGEYPVSVVTPKGTSNSLTLTMIQ